MPAADRDDQCAGADGEVDDGDGTAGHPVPLYDDVGLATGPEWDGLSPWRSRDRADGILAGGWRRDPSSHLFIAVAAALYTISTQRLFLYLRSNTCQGWRSH